jgi:Xaa-Pro aminopeptidase
VTPAEPLEAGRREESAAKLERLRALLRARGLAGAVVGRRDQFAWLTSGGESGVVRNQEAGVGQLVVTPDRLYLVAYTMDAARLSDGELAGLPAEVVPVRWHEGAREARALALCGGGPVLSDLPLPGAVCDPRALTRLHAPLSARELAVCRELGRRTEAILRSVADALTPEKTEREVAGELGAAYARAGMAVEVLLVGGGDHLSRYRHPLPTERRVGELVLLHPAVSWRGLHANVTRTVALGRLPPEVARRYDAVCQLQALTLTMCVPGTSFRALFEARRRLYGQLGFPDEWELHFPGGPTGYVLEDDISAAMDEAVLDAQVFDWFVTVTGAKVEELSLTLGGRRELLSATGRWPTRPFTAGDLTLETPAILLR